MERETVTVRGALR
uniref:Uncharacterized protein n=1 Tax=Arundo donax TaxID=35708 RepID=A0A0A8ZST0_ARUDO